MFNNKTKLKIMKNLKVTYRQLEGHYNYYNNYIYYTSGDEYKVLVQINNEINKITDMLHKIEEVMDQNRRI